MTNGGFGGLGALQGEKTEDDAEYQAASAPEMR